MPAVEGGLLSIPVPGIPVVNSEMEKPSTLTIGGGTSKPIKRKKKKKASKDKYSASAIVKIKPQLRITLLGGGKYEAKPRFVPGKENVMRGSLMSNKNVMMQEEEYIILLINNILLMQMFNEGYKVCESYVMVPNKTPLFESNFARLHALAAEAIYHKYYSDANPAKKEDSSPLSQGSNLHVYDFLFEAIRII